MKIQNRFSILCIVMCMQLVWGAVPKKPLLELFTRSSCGYCTEANPIIDSVLALNKDAYTLIRYAISDDLYATSEGTTRAQYYPGGFATPGLYINADRSKNNASGGAKSFDQEMFDYYAEETTNLRLSVSAILSEDSTVTVTTNITALEEYTSGLTLHTAVVERVTTQKKKGIRYENLLMKMAPSATGTLLPALEKEKTEVLTERVDLRGTHVETLHDLWVSVFIQNSATKEVIQSEMVPVTHAIPVHSINWTIVDKKGLPVKDATVSLVNTGSTPLIVETLYSNNEGEISIENLPQGAYLYSVEKPGYTTLEGTATIDASDIDEELLLQKPDFYLYEDFDYAGDDYADAPAGWKALTLGSGDQIYAILGKITLYKGGSSSSPVSLVLPEIDFSLTDTLNFLAGYVMGTDVVEIRSSTSPSLTGSSMITEVTLGIPMETYSVALKDIDSTHHYLILSYKGSKRGDSFAIDKLSLSNGGSTAVASTLQGKYSELYSLQQKVGSLLIKGPHLQSIGLYSPQGRELYYSSGARRYHIDLHQWSGQSLIGRIQTSRGVSYRKILAQ